MRCYAWTRVPTWTLIERQTPRRITNGHRQVKRAVSRHFAAPRKEISAVGTRRGSTGSLLSGKLHWGHARQDESDFRSFAGLAIESEPAAQTIRDDAIDNMQAEARATLIAPRREERIERLTPDTVIHAAAVVGKKNLDIVIP